MDRPDSYTVPGEMMNRIYNTLMSYANQTTYEAPRIGGVLAGCPRGPEPSPEELTLNARWMIREIDRDLLGRKETSQYWPLTLEERNEFDTLKRKVADAIEHAGYLADAVEAYMRSRNALDLAIESVEDEVLTEDDLQPFRDSVSDHWRGLQQGVYEFRKRAERASRESSD